MPGIVRMSDAAALGLHTAVYLAATGDRRVTSAEVAKVLHASPTHLAKVLQRLVHAGIAESVRGPHGGFRLARLPGEVTLMQVYEAVEGPFQATTCLLGKPICDGRRRILGTLLQEVNEVFRRHMTQTCISDVCAVFGKAVPR